MKRIIYFTPSILLLGFILFLSFAKISVPEEGLKIPHIDKIVHFIMYCTMSFTILFDWTRAFSFRRVSITGSVTAFIITATIGSSIEFLQSIVTLTRTTELYDLVANLSGATFGVLIGCMLIDKIISMIDHVIKASPFRLKS